MKRRDFIKTTAMASSVCFVPVSLLQNTSPFSKDILLGKGDPQLFGNGYNLLEEAHLAFLEMSNAAKKDNISIQVVSSYRNYAHQKRIWNNKHKRFTRQGLKSAQAIAKIIEYSTIPGTSRHHWGTDIDIIDANQPTKGDVLVPSKFHGDGPFCNLKNWMDAYANDFGFTLVYTNVETRKGFKYEPWHYSFAKISKPMLKAYRDLNIREELLQTDILGKDNFTESFINGYLNENILDINPILL